MTSQPKASPDVPAAESCSPGNHSPDIVKVEEALSDDKTGPKVVNWDNENDPQNPLNWGKSVKWRNLAVISAMNIVT